MRHRCPKNFGAIMATAKMAEGEQGGEHSAGQKWPRNLEGRAGPKILLRTGPGRPRPDLDYAGPIGQTSGASIRPAPR